MWWTAFDLTDMEEFTTWARSEELNSHLQRFGGFRWGGWSERARQPDCSIPREEEAKLSVALVGVLSPSRSLPKIPPLGLDSLVTRGDDVAEQVNKAVQLLAARIWPADAATRARELHFCQVDSDVVIDFPRTLDDFRGVLTLRFKIYQTLGYLP